MTSSTGLEVGLGVDALPSLALASQALDTGLADFVTGGTPASVEFTLLGLTRRAGRGRSDTVGAAFLLSGAGTSERGTAVARVGNHTGCVGTVGNLAVQLKVDEARYDQSKRPLCYGRSSAVYSRRSGYWS